MPRRIVWRVAQKKTLGSGASKSLGKVDLGPGERVMQLVAREWNRAWSRNRHTRWGI